MRDDDGVVWRKSTRSGNQGAGACVEVGFGPDGTYRIRDTKNREAGSLVLGERSYRDFLEAVKTGQFDPTDR